MIRTRLTDMFALDHPIVSAPMAGAGGGALAAAVSNAGGLGLIGGSYCDGDWIATQFAAAGNAPVGCGLISWKLAEVPEVLDAVLARKPRALFLSFGPLDGAAAVKAAGVPLIVQVQTMAMAEAALAAGADVIVAQGTEAGGHGAVRGTFTLVPELADWRDRVAPDMPLLAAGGVADGRGLAAALMLGADGVLMGTRFWASAEALVPQGFHEAALAANGDATARGDVPDRARGLNWPAEFNVRALRNDFTERWADADLPEAEAARFRAALLSGDAAVGTAPVGEAIGLIRDLPPAREIVARVAAEAAALLGPNWERT